jgi:hypothetical protein
MCSAKTRSVALEMAFVIERTLHSLHQAVWRFQSRGLYYSSGLRCEMDCSSIQSSSV